MALTSRVPNCRCGKVKTEENTSVQTNYYGDKSLRYLCKECDTKRMRELGWSKKTDADLIMMREKHITNAERIAIEIRRRNDEW